MSRFEALLDSAPDAILLVDAAGQITLSNRRTQELFGYAQADLLGEPVELLIPERFRAGHLSHREGYAADPQTREMGAGLDLYGRRQDGSEFPVEISLSPLREGEETKVITIVRDVSDRRGAELERLELAREQASHAEAEAGRKRLASILGEIDAIVWEADVRRRRFSFVSKRAEDVLGYPLSTWLDVEDFWRGIVEPEDLPLAELYFQEAIGRASDHDYEYRVRHADGRVLWIRDRVRVTGNGDEERKLRGVAVDVTARRELEERLMQSQKMDAVGQLAGGVAHDFNNLLVVISGYTELLLGQLEDDKAQSQLQEIRQAARRASELTAQLLAFGRRAPSVNELIDLNGLIRRIEPMLRRLIDEDISLSLSLGARLGSIRADPGQLEQVLLNLVINARDAMPLGGEVRITTSGADLAEAQAEDLGLAPGGYVLLSVGDNGSGMTSETKARIFEPFFTTKEQGKGTGLGLATVYGIVEQFGGRITVETELGRGTTFTVQLPLAIVTEGEAGEVVDDRAETPTVLVVEDEPAVRRLVRSVLEGLDYRVHESENGREALEFLERHTGRIDLVLTDVVMPEMTGPELFGRMTEVADALPFMFMSGYADSQLLSRGLSEQRFTILRKPFTSDELKARVAEAIAAGEQPVDEARSI